MDEYLRHGRRWNCTFEIKLIVVVSERRALNLSALELIMAFCEGIVKNDGFSIALGWPVHPGAPHFISSLATPLDHDRCIRAQLKNL
jgi:hypothetical protein